MDMRVHTDSTSVFLNVNLYDPTARSPERGRKEEEEEEEEGGAAIGFMGQLQVEAVIKEMAAKVKQVHINQFTSLCKNLQKRQEWEDRGGGIYDDLMVSHRLPLYGTVLC